MAGRKGKTSRRFYCVLFLLLAKLPFTSRLNTVIIIWSDFQHGNVFLILNKLNMLYAVTCGLTWAYNWVNIVNFMNTKMWPKKYLNPVRFLFCLRKRQKSSVINSFVVYQFDVDFTSFSDKRNFFYLTPSKKIQSKLDFHGLLLFYKFKINICLKNFLTKM